MKSLRKLAGRTIRAVPWLRRQWDISSDYELISEAEMRGNASRGWLSPLTAWRQDKAYGTLLAQMHAGNPRIDLVIAGQAIDALQLDEASLLEVGCGSGYYSEILPCLSRTKIKYSGVDYSSAMVTRARHRYPNGDFRQMDATSMSFADASYDIVFNGVSLMHIPDWRRAVSESRRVVRHACIFHTVPVFSDRATAYIRKYAYGSPVTEQVFNRKDLLNCFSSNGLRVAQSWSGLAYDVHAVAGEHSYTETYLCVPVNAT